MKRPAIALAAAAAALLHAGAAWAATSYPNDYFFVSNDDQWSLTGTAASINMPAAWCASTGAGIVVADVDSGANFAHPDLQGKLIAGAAFLNDNPVGSGPSGTGAAAVSDDFGHGSMTTGIMVARTGNGQGIASVAPDAQALIVKVLNSSGSGYTNDVASGIRWAADNGANVINISIGPGEVVQGTGIGASTGNAITQAINYAASKGVAVALAAGNGAIPTADYITLRQNLQAVIVGALGPSDQIASYSNYGYNVNLYAPGGDAPSQSDQTLQNEIVSTYIQDGNFNYAIGEGTSFATPMVAGVLADVMAVNGKNAQQAIQTVTSRTGTSADGAPQLDAAAALGRSKSQLCGSASTAGTVAPSGFIGSGGHPASLPPATPKPAAPRTSTPAPAATRQAVAAATSPTPSATAGSGSVQSGGGGADPGGRAQPPENPSGSGGGGGTALLIVLLVLIVVGAPAAAAIRGRMRGA